MHHKTHKIVSTPDWSNTTDAEGQSAIKAAGMAWFDRRKSVKRTYFSGPSVIQTMESSIWTLMVLNAIGRHRHLCAQIF